MRYLQVILISMTHLGSLLFLELVEMKTLYITIILILGIIITSDNTVFAQNVTMSMHVHSEPTPFNLKLPQDRQIHLRFLDANNTQMKDMAYSITITRDNQQLLNSFFYSHSGNLTLNLQPSNATGWFVGVDHDTMGCNYYSSLTDNFIIYVKGTLQEGTYHFEIQPALPHISYGCYIPKSMGINFETDLNLLDAYNETITPQIIPEFPFAVPILLLGITSLIVFYKIKLVSSPVFRS